jgi:hypothetical protein
MSKSEARTIVVKISVRVIKAVDAAKPDDPRGDYRFAAWDGIDTRCSVC